MKHNNAFSLLEMLLALVIIAMISFAVSTTVLSGSRSNADNRIRTQALAAADAWMDRFRSYSLPFNYYVGGKSYGYGYDYAQDPTITASGDINAAEVNGEWSNFRFFIQTFQLSTNPVLWRIEVTTYYRKKAGGEANIKLVTIR